MGIGVDLDAGNVGGLVPGERIEFADGFDLIAEEAEAPGAILEMRGEELDRVAAHTKRAACEVLIVAPVMQSHEIREEPALIDALAAADREGHGGIGLDIADAIDAGDGCDDDHIIALQQRACRRVAHPVDLLVDRALLLDIGVGSRHIGFGLVVIVIGNGILDRIVG